MRPLTAQELLHVWEEGHGRTPGERALLLLARACPDEAPEALLALPVGSRDGRLLRLREWTFGPEFTSLARCPACGEPLELSFSAADVRAGAEPPPGEVLSVREAGYEATFRLPNGADLAAVAGPGGRAEARGRLLRRCLLGARRNGKARPVGRLPGAVLRAVAERMGEADPQADVQTALTCPACGHAWSACFEILAYFWAEIESWARAILRDVHRLAAAYCWREADILALSPARRRLYLEMVRA